MTTNPVVATRGCVNDGILLALASPYRASVEEVTLATISPEEVAVLRVEDGIFEVFAASLRAHEATLASVLREAKMKRVDAILHTHGAAPARNVLRTAPRGPVALPTRIRRRQDEVFIPATPVAYVAWDGKHSSHTKTLIHKNSSLPTRVRIPRLIDGTRAHIFTSGGGVREEVKIDRRRAFLCIEPMFDATGCSR